MSVVMGTLLPRECRFPHLLPPVPCTHPIPLRSAGYEPMYGRMNEYRDLQREMDELSEEEHELEEMDNNIRIRGFKTIVLIGHVKTQQEEKPPSVMEGEEEEEEEEEEARDSWQMFSLTPCQNKACSLLPSIYAPALQRYIC
ncbi:uncharacterized protein ARMOST_20291 [Armillaria ostoyae]|uniref:Uncharacterized protein n=1 Tax=Armillaria ostoyae TaxID=47428 RepID=A0A284S6W8_ARMOS|nr:uncharacterized protein ARMOST_20291 [Armillaria ostoyae]